MIITKEEFFDDNSKFSVTNEFTKIKVPGTYVRLFESVENSSVDYDVQKYHDLISKHGAISYIGMTFPDTFHSDKLILKKVLEFKGNKFVLIKNNEIACVFDDLTFLVRALVEFDCRKIGSFSPVNTILDADTGQAVILFYTDPNHVYSNF